MSVETKCNVIPFPKMGELIVDALMKHEGLSRQCAEEIAHQAEVLKVDEEYFQRLAQMYDLETVPDVRQQINEFDWRK
jgi:hypothetical protein